MYIDNVKKSNNISPPADLSKNIPIGTSSFSEMIEEMQKARSAPALVRERSRESEQCEDRREDWEKEWEAEQRRIERQRKMSDRAEEQRKQAAIHRAAKRKRLLEYMLFLKETSMERAKEEMQRIEKRDEKDIDKTRYRKKTVYVPVNYAGCAVYSNLFDNLIK